MKLYNSLSKNVESLEERQTVRIYSCGPTVYERVHIGNLASFIYADTLRRVLESSGHEVQHVMNITDVDDKTIKASHEKYPDLEPLEALKKLSGEYEELFMDDIRAVGIDSDKITFVRATDNIEPMQQLIRKLVEGGFAYLADDGVYFSIEKYTGAGKQYGQLADVSVASTSGSRIDNDEYDKDSARDFALWKRRKDGEPAWDFEINGTDMAGRPGWHIECSAMSVKCLGQPFDIHTGGVDLKFPHHENEIAQSTALDTERLANLFFHNEHILVEAQKMSKSLNNFFTLKDITDKGFDPLAFRLFVLEGKYSNQRSFSWENLEAASSRLEHWRRFAELRYQAEKGETNESPAGEAIDKLQKAFANDLDTPDVLKIVDELIPHIESHGLANIYRQPLEELLSFLDRTLGLALMNRQDIADSQRALIAQREEARRNSQWDESDRLRQQLEEQGIGINDTDNGPVWYRK